MSSFRINANQGQLSKLDLYKNIGFRRNKYVSKFLYVFNFEITIFVIKSHFPYTPTVKIENCKLISNTNYLTGFHLICENAEDMKRDHG